MPAWGLRAEGNTSLAAFTTACAQMPPLPLAVRPALAARPGRGCGARLELGGESKGELVSWRPGLADD